MNAGSARQPLGLSLRSGAEPSVDVTDFSGHQIRDGHRVVAAPECAQARKAGSSNKSAQYLLA
jgi:hypothetical protein